jgi:cardiolipin synthase
VLGLCLLVLGRFGYGPPPVHYVGKTATFILLMALPTLLLAAAVPSTAGWAHPAGWSLAWWGLVLYWIAALFYVVQVLGVVRSAAGSRP